MQPARNLVGGQYRVGLLVSGIQQAEAFASAMHTVAQRFAASPATTRAAVLPVPVMTAPARQLKRLKVSVPNIVGMTEAAAATAATGAGLVLGAVAVQSSDTVAMGSVIGQGPIAGTSLNVGSAVNPVVSRLGEGRGGGECRSRP